MPTQELEKEIKILDRSEYSINEKFDLLPYAMLLHIHNSSEAMIQRRAWTCVDNPNNSHRTKQWAIQALALRLRYHGNINEVQEFLSMASTSRLIGPVNNQAINSLKKQTQQSKKSRNSTKNSINKKRRIAILLSGYPRVYETGYEIYMLRENNPEWAVDVFCYSFERLGDLYAPKGSPPELIDYGHGGLQREISKTLAIDRVKLKESLGDCKLVIHDRQQIIGY